MRRNKKESKGRKGCSQSLHTHFITGWVVQVKGTRGIVPGGGPFTQGMGRPVHQICFSAPSSGLQAVRDGRAGAHRPAPTNPASPHNQLLGCFSPQPAAPPTTIMQLQERK